MCVYMCVYVGIYTYVYILYPEPESPKPEPEGPNPEARLVIRLDILAGSKVVLLQPDSSYRAPLRPRSSLI